MTAFLELDVVAHAVAVIRVLTARLVAAVV